MPNTTHVKEDPQPAGTPDEDGRRRVVYLGSITLERGAREMVEVGRRLRVATDGRVLLHLLGPTHGRAAEVVRAAHLAEDVRWHGFVPNDEALSLVEGSLAGLSLLHDEANFRPSMPTKVVEYLAHGVPAITTPLPVAVDLVRRSGGGVVVPFGDVDRTAAQLLAWDEDPDTAAEVGRRGHEVVAREYDWQSQAGHFVEAIEQAARDRRTDG